MLFCRHARNGRLSIARYKPTAERQERTPVHDGAIAVIGAGPAGLSAAYELVRHQPRAVVVFEKAGTVGGLARTEVHNGYRFDVGGHRFFTRIREVQELWEEALGQ